MNHVELVTVYTADDPIQAEVVKNALEADGIQAVVDRETQGGFGGSTLSMVRVQVRAEDEARARAAIAYHEGPEDDLAEDEEVPGNPEDEEGVGLDVDDEP